MTPQPAASLAPLAAPRRPGFWHGRGALVLSALAGAFAALGLEPFHLWFLTPFGLALALLLLAHSPSPRVGALRAWAAGAGWFALSLNWIIEPFLVDIVRHGWMAPFALILMAGGLALFWGLAGWIAVCTVPARMGRIWIAALALVALEDLRGWVFTGFPWSMVGHVWIGTPMDQLAALGGALGLSILSTALAASIACGVLVFRARRWVAASAFVLLAGLISACIWVAGSYRLDLPENAVAHGPAGQPIRLVQANIPQDLKWDFDYVEAFFRRHLDLSAVPATPAPALVIWPETAAPFFLDRPGDGLGMIARAAQAPSIIGLQRRERRDGVQLYFNSLVVLDASGEPTAQYDKHHLVPFGEYIPLIGAWAETQGWGGLASRVLSGYTPGPGPELLDLGRLGRAVPVICYEAIFPRNLRVPGNARADWILQLTNDAWFGTYSGPFQHLAQAQLRAIELGLPFVRAANTGVSAVIDARGRIVAELGMNQTGALDARLPAALPPTPYARWGDLPVRLVLWLGLGLSLGLCLCLALIVSSGPIVAKRATFRSKD